ncbi:Polyisoprenoid-binding protein YceI [Reichenbachiella faecimaris]|uniref:Polyisoprenoid-binding protein YceI n=1 Tax=Reichenbachiella faecimaris TaxID=692418 RepID=A0A1W2GFD2_REIFA|nr:YceI family protein [Reichenbachiella faecimaris]SMD34976.1 Polyisoprenoid-binding protein YceI [Reichenbachiella faecimaris]
MLNVLLLAIGLNLNPVETNTTYETNVSESSVVWTATKVVSGGHTGTVKIAKGSLEIEGSELKGGSFEIDMTSIANTDIEGEWRAKLEGHLKSDDFFAVETYKTAAFKITDVKSTAKGKYNVTGDLTIKGKTESVTFPTELTVKGNKATATAKITIDRTKYDVRYGSPSFFDDLGDKAISNEFTLDISLIATK